MVMLRKCETSLTLKGMREGSPAVGSKVMDRFTTIVLIFSIQSIFLYAQTKNQGHDHLQVNPQALNFIFMGDWGRNGKYHQKQVARQMGKTASQADVDFIVTAGDNFYPSGVTSEYDSLWKYSYEDIYTDSSLQRDWYPVLGNHDYGLRPDAQIAYSRINPRWRMPARYYSKKINLDRDSSQQVLFVFIDTSPLIRKYYLGSANKVHDQDSSAQKSWLENTLANASSNVKWKFVIGHHPMYTGGSRTENYDTRSIRRSLQPIFEKYKVDAYLAGHEHSLQHMVAPDKIHHFISGSASQRTRARMLPISKFSRSKYGFMLFSVTPQNVIVQVLSDKGNVLYSTEIKK
jgi:tartrate-resistant acid phosphatase type 5